MEDWDQTWTEDVYRYTHRRQEECVLSSPIDKALLRYYVWQTPRQSRLVSSGSTRLHTDCRVSADQCAAAVQRTIAITSCNQFPPQRHGQQQQPPLLGLTIDPEPPPSESVSTELSFSSPWAARPNAAVYDQVPVDRRGAPAVASRTNWRIVTARAMLERYGDFRWFLAWDDLVQWKKKRSHTSSAQLLRHHHHHHHVCSWTSWWNAIWT